MSHDFFNNFDSSFLPTTPHTMTVSRKIKKEIKKKKKLYFYFVYTLIRHFWALGVTVRDWNSYNLTFGGICFFFVYHSSIIPTILQAYRTVATLLEHSMEGPLGHRWLIRHFGDIHYRQSRHIPISIVGPSDSKYADCDTILPAVCVCPGLWRDLRYICVLQNVFHCTKSLPVDRGFVIGRRNIVSSFCYTY